MEITKERIEEIFNICSRELSGEPVFAPCPFQTTEVIEICKLAIRMMEYRSSPEALWNNFVMQQDLLGRNDKVLFKKLIFKDENSPETQEAIERLRRERYVPVEITFKIKED